MPSRNLSGRRALHTTWNAYWIPGTLIAASLLLGIGIILLPHAAGAFWPFSPASASEGGTARPMVHDSSIDLLDAALNPDPNPAKGRGDITTTEGSALIAYAGPTGTLADVDKLESGGAISIYVVRPGDSLSGIADMFDVSTNTILWANNLSAKAAITPGTTLVILPVSGVRHAVTKGETLQSLAKRYGADAADIASYNGLDTATALAVGTEVIIPGGELAAAPAKKKAPVAAKSKIRAGGGLGSILPTGDTASGASSGFTNPAPGGRLSQGIHGWNGVDIAAPVGTAIKAAAAGTVIVSRVGGWNGGYGNYVVIDHGNGVQTLYAHMNTDNVSVGQSVGKGETIGSVGRTGQATGYHLHFEVRGAKNPFGS